MILTEYQQALIDGKYGDVLAKVTRTLVKYGEVFGAPYMVSVSSNSGHLVTSFGSKAMKPVSRIMDELIKNGLRSKQPFSVGPRPVDRAIPASVLQLIGRSYTYSRQKKHENQLKKLGYINEDAFSCTCYMDEVGNIPNKGDVLSWAESSAVIYANSVLGARCNLNSALVELFGSIVGFVPYFGLLTDEGRKATWIVEVKTNEMPEAQLLGTAISSRVGGEVPYITGLDNWIGTLLTQGSCDFLKDMGGAAVVEGSMGLYHVDNLTPEAIEFGHELISKDAQKYVVDDAELARIRAEQDIGKNVNRATKMCFIGCPHLSLTQLVEWTHKLIYSLKDAQRTKLSVMTVFTAAPGVIRAFNEMPESGRLKNMGGIVSYACPAMYMSNPFCSGMPVMTNSRKLTVCTSAIYYTDDEIAEIITRGARL
jgi:Uncharacterized conserved protein